MDYNIRELTIGDYEEAMTLTICDLRLIPEGSGSSIFFSGRIKGVRYIFR